MDKNDVLKQIRLIDLIVEARNQYRAEKNFAMSDALRDDLSKLGVVMIDKKGEPSTWEFMPMQWDGKQFSNIPQRKKIFVPHTKKFPNGCWLFEENFEEELAKLNNV